MSTPLTAEVVIARAKEKGFLALWYWRDEKRYEFICHTSPFAYSIGFRWLDSEDIERCVEIALASGAEFPELFEL